MLRRVWAHFDEGGPLIGREWPIRYKWSDAERVGHLRTLGVRMFSALAYAHKPEMAAELNEWTLEFGRAIGALVRSLVAQPPPAALEPAAVYPSLVDAFGLASAQHEHLSATAVAYAPYGDSVFVVDEHKDEKTGKVQQVLRQQFVQLGEPRGDFVSVRKGLKPGENVVTSGVFKLRQGMPVAIDNKLAPNAEIAPKPKDA